MANPTAIPNVAALADLVGRELGKTDWIEVSQEQIEAVAEATGDHQWIHVDTERATRESPFDGKTVAHGNLTLSLAPVLLPEIVVVKNTSMVVNYGVDKARFKRQVVPGDQLRLKASYIAVKRNILKFSGEARVDGQLVASAEFMVAELRL